jgi:hypothetical protein
VVLGTGSDAYAEASRKIELLNIKQAAQRQKDAENGLVTQVDGTTDEGAAIIVDTTATSPTKADYWAGCQVIADAVFADTVGETDPEEAAILELWSQTVAAMLPPKAKH